MTWKPDDTLKMKAARAMCCPGEQCQPGPSCPSAMHLYGDWASHALIAAHPDIIEAERAKADALAEALREIAKDDDLVAASDGAFGLQAYRRCRDQARAALAAYDAEAK